MCSTLGKTSGIKKDTAHNFGIFSVPPEKVELFVPELTAAEENELECRAEKSKPPAVISWLGVENIKHEIVEYTVNKINTTNKILGMNQGTTLGKFAA